MHRKTHFLLIERIPIFILKVIYRTMSHASVTLKVFLGRQNTYNIKIFCKSH